MEEWIVEGLVGGAGEGRERGSRGRGWEAGSRYPLRLGQFLGLVRSWPPVLIGELFLVLLVFTPEMVDNRSLDETKINLCKKALQFTFVPMLFASSLFATILSLKNRDIKSDAQNPTFILFFISGQF